MGWMLTVAFLSPTSQAVEQTRELPPPLSPEESLSKIKVPEGFQIELVAAEPLLLDPVAFDWDAKGRLWVVEMADYPMGMDGKDAPGGRIRCLEDRDRDGIYEHSTLFAEKLNFPTGILCWKDGVLVTAAPEILYLKDEDNDGKVDTREVLIRGFYEGNQQLRVNGLRWSHDHWVYCAIGAHTPGHGKDAEILSLRNGQKLPIGARDFRFNPETGEIEPQSGPTQFGRNRDDWGNWFGTQNSWPLWHYVLSDHYLRRNPHYAAPSPRNDLVRPSNPKIYPLSPPSKRYHSFDQAGHFTAACSGMVYRDRLLFPEDAPNRAHAFVCEPAGNVIQSYELTPEGATFRATRFPQGDHHDFFASEDPWCRPVMIRTGPDGSLWIADMYRYMIEHPHWLPQEGKDELLPHYRLGEDKGRIYRIQRQGMPSAPVPDLTALSLPDLIASLESSNGWIRDQAHRCILWSHADDSKTCELLQTLFSKTKEPLAKLHVLAILDHLGKLESSALQAAMTDASPGLRENAIRLAEKYPFQELLETLTPLTQDTSAKVKLQLAFSLGNWKDQDAGKLLATLIPNSDQDPWLKAAILSSSLPHLTSISEQIAKLPPQHRQSWNLDLWNMLLAAKDRNTLNVSIRPILERDENTEAKEIMLQAHEFLAFLTRKQLTRESLILAESDALAETLKKFDRLFNLALAVLKEHRDTSQPLPLEAAKLLGHQPEHHALLESHLRRWLTSPEVTGETFLDLLSGLSDLPQEIVLPLLSSAWEVQSPANRVHLLDIWLKREAWVQDLLQQIEQKHMPVSAIDPTRRSQLLNHPTPQLKARAEKIFQTLHSSTRKSIVEQYQKALSLEGDRQKGKEIFRLTCAGCHRFGEEGLSIGPEISAFSEHPPEKILTNILDPNLDIQPGYQAYLCKLKSGESIFGIVTAETPHSLTIKRIDAQEIVILRQDIESLKSTGSSLMPEGLEAAITVEQMSHLIQFIRTSQTESQQNK